MLRTIDADVWKIINILNQDPNGVRLTQAEVLYVDYLVSNMKAIGTWNLSKAIYGFVGNTAYKQKWNWKDMRDLDIAFRLVFSGTVTHTANGFAGNGVSGLANTNFSPSANLLNNSAGITLYSTVNTTNSTDNTDVGSGDTNNVFRATILRGDANLAVGIITNTTTTPIDSNFISNTNVKGFFQTNVNNIEAYSYIRNIKTNYNSNQFANNTLPSPNVFIGALGSVGGVASQFSNKTFGLVILHEGMTITQTDLQEQHSKIAQNILNRA